MPRIRTGYIVMAVVAALLLPLNIVLAKSAAPIPRTAEMPELSGLGPFRVGTTRRDIKIANREIGVRLWYPAITNPKTRGATYQHSRLAPGQKPLRISERGIAVPAAKPDRSAKFPLVLISHGYGGWAEHMSQLGEALSSNGYVVASIDHRDQPFHDGATFARSFGSVLISRASDQQSVLRAIRKGQIFDAGIAEQIDSNRVGLIGFSMGSYGALTTSGIHLDPQAPAFGQLPAAMRLALPQPDAELAGSIKAVVAMAPWGAQPGAAAWADKDIAKLATPLLLIDGDQDDVVSFRDGVSRLFAVAKASDRYLLVYREAAHNIAGNPVMLPVDADFPAIEYVSDPVWRKDRIEAINQHYILAFLNLWLKSDGASRAYLDVPTRSSNDGLWPSTFGQQWGGMVAGDKQPGYWRGFQRRWARGLELHHKAAGE